MMSGWLLAAVVLVVVFVAIMGVITTVRTKRRIDSLEHRHAVLLDAVITATTSVAELIANDYETRGEK